MTKIKQQINIFVACGIELEQEKKVIIKLAEEVNNSYADEIGFLYKVSSWENTIVPGMASYPQEVINKQILGKFDILIALFGPRIGTPTLSFESGTVEEIENVISQNKSSTNHIHLLVYFKNSPIILNQIDIEQLDRLRKYKKSLSDRGVLYTEFLSIKKFESQLRSHLNKILTDFSKSSESTNSIIEPGFLPELPKVLSSQSDEFGFFDFIEVTITETQKASKIVESWGLSLHAMSKKTTEITDEVNELQKTPRPDLFLYRKAVNKQAHNWDKFVELNINKIPEYEESVLKSMQAYKSMILMVPDFGKDEDNLNQLKSVYDSLVILKDSVIGERESSLRLFDVTEKLPNLTKELMQSKKNVLNAFSNWQKAADKAIMLIDENISLCKAMLDSW